MRSRRQQRMSACTCGTRYRRVQRGGIPRLHAAVKSFVAFRVLSRTTPRSKVSPLPLMNVPAAYTRKSACRRPCEHRASGVTELSDTPDLPVIYPLNADLPISKIPIDLRVGNRQQIRTTVCTPRQVGRDHVTDPERCNNLDRGVLCDSVLCAVIHARADPVR